MNWGSVEQAFASWIFSLIRLPKKWKRPLVLASIVFFLGLSARNLYLDGWKLRSPFYRDNDKKGLKSTNINDSLVPYNPELLGSKVGPITCSDGKYCSGFNEESDWIGWQGFDRSQNNSGLLRPRIGSGFDNPNLWFQKINPSPIFDFDLKFIPKNDTKINVVVVYEKIWRCIIGETNFNTITCEENYSSHNKTRHSSSLTALNKLPISPQSEIIINGSTLVSSTNRLQIRLQLQYIDIEQNKESVDLSFQLGFPSPDPKSFRGSVGVGIIDPNSEGITVEFKEFSLQPR